MKRGRPPNAAEKRWLNAVAISYAGCVIHHPVGSTGKHNKVEIGHWWIIPMMDWDHKALHSHCECFGYESRKAFEKAKFEEVLANPNIDSALVPLEAIEAIRSYHR